MRLRALDAEVIDAERALAVPGDDDVADLLARTEALRERSRGLANLVAERRRGLERELAAVADEGVVESLVAEAAQLREQLRRGRRRRRGARARPRAEVDAAEARLADARRRPVAATTAEAAHHARRARARAGRRRGRRRASASSPQASDALERARAERAGVDADVRRSSRSGRRRRAEAAARRAAEVDAAGRDRAPS